MTEYDNTDRFTLFKNDLEGKKEGFPEYGGTINVNGTEYWISAWIKEGKSGKFFSGSIKLKEPKQPQAEPNHVGNAEQDMPF